MTVGEKAAREELAKRVDALLGKFAGSIRAWNDLAWQFSRDVMNVVDLKICDLEPIIDPRRKLLELARHLHRLAALGMIDADVQERIDEVFCKPYHQQSQGGPHNRIAETVFHAAVTPDALKGWKSPEPSLPPLAWTEAHYRYEITALDARLDEIRRVLRSDVGFWERLNAAKSHTNAEDIRELKAGVDNLAQQSTADHAELKKQTADRLREKKPKLTQEETAEIWKVNPRTVRRWDKGEGVPDEYPGRNVTAVEMKQRAKEWTRQKRLAKAASQGMKNRERLFEGKNDSDATDDDAE